MSSCVGCALWEFRDAVGERERERSPYSDQSHRLVGLDLRLRHAVKTKGLFLIFFPCHQITGLFFSSVGHCVLFLCWSRCSCKAQQEQSNKWKISFSLRKKKKGPRNLTESSESLHCALKKNQTGHAEFNNFSCGLSCLEFSLWHHNIGLRPPATSRLLGPVSWKMP